MKTDTAGIEIEVPRDQDGTFEPSALDGLADNAYQVVIEGESYRSRQRPGQGATPSPRTRRK